MSQESSRNTTRSGAPTTARAVGDVAASGLQPPAQTTYGHVSPDVTLAAWTQVNPGARNERTHGYYPDDKAIDGNWQTVAGGTVLNDLWVYLVDGKVPPYYVVILKQSGTLGPGTVLATGQDGAGWFQYAAQLAVNFPALAAGDSAGVTPLGTSPATWTSSSTTGPQTQVDLSVSMSLRAPVAPVPFDAGVADTLWLTDWGVQNQPQPDGGTEWTFHQVTGWDPTVDPPATFAEWYKGVFGNQDRVPIIDASLAGLQVETASAWKFDSSLVDPTNKSLVVTFSGSVTQNLAVMHNPHGCLGAAGSPAHHLYTVSRSEPWSTRLDLASTVAHG